jgi:hypothetical protein
MKAFRYPKRCHRPRSISWYELASFVVALAIPHAVAQKAPVDLAFDVTSAKRQQLQSVPITVSVSSKRELPFLMITSSAAAYGEKPEMATAENMKKNDTATVQEKLLFSDKLASYFSIALSSTKKELDEFRTPVTVDVPISHAGSTVKFGKPMIGKPKSEDIVSQTKVSATAVEAPEVIEGYKVSTTLSMGVQKAGLQLSSKDVAKLDVYVGTDGGVSVVSAKPLFKSIPVSTETVVEEVPFAIALGERGKVVGQVVGKDATGKVLYGRRTILYVVADERKLYTGTSSFLDLDIQKLKDDLHEGLIKQGEYERKLTLLLSGEVTETN